MKINKKLLALAVLAGVVTAGASFVDAGTACLWSGSNCSTPTTVTVAIKPGDICIGSEGAFNFGNYNVSTSSQTVNGTFATPFWVEDLKGADAWYYTTVQMSGNLQGSGTNSIASSNISMRANGGITTMAGTANTSVVVNSAVAGAYQPLNNPVTLIKRDNAVNYGRIGRYGTTPSLQLVIPAYQSVGTYTGTLVYTLYNN